MELTQGVVALTEHKDVLARLSKMGMVRKKVSPKTNQTKDCYTAQYDGRFLDFFSGEPKVFPVNIAKALEASNMTHLTAACVHCNGKGSTTAGICINCKGKRNVIKDSDEGKELKYRILKVLRTYDPMMVDPDTLQPAPAVAEEAAVVA